LVLVLPILWGDMLRHLMRFASNRQLDASALLVRGSQAVIAVFLLYVNGTRSAVVGAGVALLFGLPIVIGIVPARFAVRLLRPGILAGMAGTGALLLIVSVLGFAFGKHRLAYVDFGRHTDFQRAVIWNGSGELIADHPLLGVGPGNFRAATLDWRRSFLQQEPHTLYWIYLTPSGHAHNDLLHLAVVGGLPGGLLFLGLALACVLAGRSGTPTRRWFFLGTAGFFIAGLFQCYFQDDEVAAVFWMLIAMIGATRPASAASA
jgi:O-antigen ligase